MSSTPLLLCAAILLAQILLCVSTDCPSGDCRSLKPPTLPLSTKCWSVKEAAGALLKLQCQLADCLEPAAFPDAAVGGQTTSQAMLERLFAYVDRNSNGLATQSELLTALESAKPSSPGCIDVQLTTGEAAASSEDTGVGKRRFAALLGIHVAETTQKAVTSLLEEGSELQLSALVDRDFRMRCPLSRVGKAEKFAWSRHGNGLGAGWRFSRRWTVHADDTLLLKSVTAADAGIYQCCSSVWHRLCVTLALNVIDRPRIRVHPPMQVRMVGEPARLYCQLEGSGVDQIRWLYNSKPIEPRPGLLFVGDGTDSGSHLSIAKLGKHHTGLYTCSVSNKAGIAESAGSVYVRDATETDYSSYPLSPQLWTSVGPTPTKAVVFHSDGFAVLDFEDCALKRPVAARLCGCHGGVGDNVNRDNEDQQLDGECDWVGDSGGHLLAAAGRLLFAALPLQQRLLAIESPAASSTKAWFSPRLLELGCRPRLLSYRRQSDTLWTACDAGRVLRLSRASSVAAAVADAEIWRVGSAGIRVLRLPDSTANLLVTLEGASASSGDGFALMVAAGVPDFDSRGGSEVDERARLLLPDSIDRADVIPQGDTLLLHSSKNFSQTPLIAVDLTTGKRIPFFSRFFSSNPTGRLVVSERADRVLHLTADTMYLYRVLPSGQLALRMHSSLDAWPLYPQFQTGPDGSERLLALADLPDGGLMAVSPGEATVRLNFDPRTRELKRLAASQFGSLALAYSANSAVFVNTSFASAAGVTSSASTDACQQILFVGLQAVHWVWPDYPDES
ncbi:hypothetical protein BOX15_Mlig026935g4 [Macrostomum lignano]|uniref:EF-hand domain-containing protein n=1 Tax=Macrostomum lignano TaxID=282301 RepID=A0A267DE04_9PLAT|nr:hypothetical protein BOX15_Mlig026935g4 [Macrostomum lignano]